MNLKLSSKIAVNKIANVTVNSAIMSLCDEILRHYTLLIERLFDWATSGSSLHETLISSIILIRIKNTKNIHFTNLNSFNDTKAILLRAGVHVSLIRSHFKRSLHPEAKEFKKLVPLETKYLRNFSISNVFIKLII